MLTMLAFSLTYLVVPNRFIHRSYALIGGLVAALMFESVKQLFTSYIANMSTYNLVYGTFASLPLFLIWIYSCWLVVLFGAVITASLTYWKNNAWQIAESPYQKFQDALRILRVLYVAYEQNSTTCLRDFKSQVPIALESLEDQLSYLVEVGLVNRDSQQEYRLIKQPQDIQLRDVYRLFFPVPYANLDLDEQTLTVMREISKTIDENLRQTLHSLFTERNDIASCQLPSSKIMRVKNEITRNY